MVVAGTGVVLGIMTMRASQGSEHSTSGMEVRCANHSATITEQVHGERNPLREELGKYHVITFRNIFLAIYVAMKWMKFILLICTPESRSVRKCLRSV